MEKVECYFCEQDTDVVPQSRIQVGIDGWAYACPACRADMAPPRKEDVEVE